MPCNSGHLWFGIAFAVSMVIGVPCSIVGCNYFYPYCVAYYPYPNAVSLGGWVEQTWCTECIVYSNVNNVYTCTAYESYACYDAYVSFELNQQQNCTSQWTSYNSQSDAQAIVNDFPSGSEKEIYVSRHDASNCNGDVSSVKALSIAGITFLSIGALVAILWTVWTIATWDNFSTCCNDPTNW